MIILALLFLSTMLLAQSPGKEVQQVQAALLYKFTHYVEWPRDSFAGKESPYQIAIYRDDLLGGFLKRAVSEKTVKGRKFTVKTSRNIDDLLNCHILFIGSSERNKLPMILEQLKGKSILVVSDMAGFAAAGGHIQIMKVNNKTRLQASPESAREAGLKISSQFLRHCKIIESKKRGR